MIRKNIPNALTIGNLFCGCLALVSASQGYLMVAAYWMGVSLVCDFFDGFAARMLKVSSPIGKDLDSLADMVTFGVLPGFVMYKLLQIMSGAVVTKAPSGKLYTMAPAIPGYEWIPYLGFVITIFSCIRLAKFNNDTRQSDSFIGLPTPANAMIILSLPLIYKIDPFFIQKFTFLKARMFVLNPYVLLPLTFLLSYLLVAELPLFALKFKHFGWKGNQLVYVFLMASVALLAFFQFMAIPMVIGLYIVLSIVNNIFLKPKQ